ncbi:alpha/beta fold hydrolase [Rhodoferax aquaticus]|uniref:Alpha/beta fold hydrolase n=1 Tax=Rhodoferax aquaticus TaxID=2527691 RepID=A0A515ERI0_9BURK|nr:alpha/beta fold hydrolase [Rhodoferax aquaticus]QDL55272.1 alpha/beta fold hydrolase [Rhodoferax aquaticus]
MRLSSPPTLSSLTTPAGYTLTVHDWRVNVGTNLRGVVLIVHGLGEHAGKYHALAKVFNRLGFSVRAYDQYGHGQSPGKFGRLLTHAQLVQDLEYAAAHTRAHMPKRLPLIVYGYGLGGLVAAHCVALQQQRVDGLILLSPAMQLIESRAKQWSVRLASYLVPHLKTKLAHFPANASGNSLYGQSTPSDRHSTKHVSARLAAYTHLAKRCVHSAAPRWNTPTLLLQSETESTTHSQTGAEFAKAVPSRVLVTKYCSSASDERPHPTTLDAALLAVQTWLIQRY